MHTSGSSTSATADKNQR